MVDDVTADILALSLCHRITDRIYSVALFIAFVPFSAALCVRQGSPEIDFSFFPIPILLTRTVKILISKI